MQNFNDIHRFTVLRPLFIFTSLIIIIISPTLIEGKGFFDLSDVKKGMKAKGSTVFEDETVEWFDLDILGVMRNVFPHQDLIIAELKGDILKRAGVISGMSGSPIYIDGKLAGSLAYRFGAFPTRPIAGIVPIKQMLNQFKGITEGQRSTRFYPPHIPDLTQPPHIKVIETPLICSGIHPEALKRFSSSWHNAGFHPIIGGSGGNGHKSSAPIIPGMSVSAQMLRGDMNISAAGTLSYVDGEKVLAFGHSLMWAGPTEIPLSRARVITIIHDQLGSYKMTVDGEEIGCIKQDRYSAIFGTLGVKAGMIPVKVGLHTGKRVSSKYSFEVFRQKWFTPSLVSLAIYNVIITESSMKGPISIGLNATMSLDGCTEPVRINDFFSGEMAALSASEKVSGIMASFMENENFNTEIKDIHATIHLSEEDLRASIKELRVNRREIRPGESFTAWVVLKPYQDAETIKEIAIQVPKNTHPGVAKVRALSAKIINQNEIFPLFKGKRKYKIDALVKGLNQLRGNRGLFLRLVGVGRGIEREGLRMELLPPSVRAIMSPSGSNKDIKGIFKVIWLEKEIPTDYSIDGSREATIKIIE